MAASGVVGGLIPKGKDAPLPLKSVSVEAQVKGFILGLQSTLTYSNDSSDPVEVLFRFPLEKTHAVVGLTAVIDGRKIAARIREKEEARQEYDDAIASGLSAALGEEKSGDVFSIALGNLPPGKDAQVHLQLVGELSVDAEAEAVRFSLPSTLKPRYTPSGSTDPLAPVPDPGDGQQVERGSVSAVSWFHLTVDGPDGVSEVTSPTHSIVVSPNLLNNQLDVHLSKELDGDLVILVKMKEPHVPRAVVESGTEKGGEFMSSPAVMLHFFPSFTDMEAACEFIFLVDRSGSMRGAYIKSASETLVLFLKSLPQGNYFNIMGFGSSFTSLFPNTVPYDEKHLEKAIQHAGGLQADLGGTELLRPLQHIFSTKTRSGFSRQVFVLTDGSVSNTDACIREMKKNIKNARCFTFGIGSGASTALVNGLARAGNGAAEFVKEGERMQPKVIRSLKRALQPAITDVTIDYEVPKELQVEKSPQSLPPVFNGEKLVVFAALKSKKKLDTAVNCSAVLKGNMLGSVVQHKIPFTLDSTIDAPPSLPVVHHLAAKALITDWETEEKEKKRIIDLSIESSVISSHTAFIAVDEESSEPVSGSMKVYDLEAMMMRRSFGSNFMCAPAMAMGGGAPKMMMMNSAPRGARTRSAPKMKKKGGGGGFFGSLFGGGAAAPAAPPPRSSRSRQQVAYDEINVDMYMSIDDDDLALESCCEVGGMLPPPTLLGGVARGAAPPPPPPPGSGNSMLQNSCFSAPPPPSATKSLENLISAQRVDGSWNMNSSFAQLIGKPLSELEAGCPIGKEGGGTTVWATVLAVSVLRSRYSSQQDEWELIAMKAESWLKKQSLPEGITLKKMFEDAKKLIH